MPNQVANVYNHAEGDWSVRQAGSIAVLKFDVIQRRLSLEITDFHSAIAFLVFAVETKVLGTDFASLCWLLFGNNGGTSRSRNRC